MTFTEWQMTSAGYEMITSSGTAKLFKDKKVWVLDLEGRRVELGRRASFDTAERALLKMVA